MLIHNLKLMSNFVSFYGDIHEIFTLKNINLFFISCNNNLYISVLPREKESDISFNQSHFDICKLFYESYYFQIRTL